MKSHWINREGSDELLVFFAGWGMDPTPFAFLKTGPFDVLMCYDYTRPDLPFDVHEVFTGYTRIDLAAWSLGVPSANQAFRRHADRFRRAVAINGSVTPIHDEYGIPPAVFDGTLENLDAGGLRRFRRRVCRSREVLERFDATMPRRDIVSLTRELRALRDRFAGVVPDQCIFTRAVVGTTDMIFPARHQLRGWAVHGVTTTTIAASHFPFYEWRHWRDLVCL